MYINTFKYTPKDVSCQLCTEYVKKLGCTALRCPWLAERIEAGVVGYREAVLETFPHERRLFQRLNLLIKHYPGSLWSNEQHERRMQYQRTVQGYRRRRDTNAYYAAIYLLTSNDDIYRRTANCFCKHGIEFGYAVLKNTSPHNYALFMAARDLCDKTEAVTMADLAEPEVIDPEALRLIVNATLIARYGLAAFRSRRGVPSMNADDFVGGHSILALERFMDDTRHMIIFDVLSWKSPVGEKGERLRLFLSDVGYAKAQASEKRGEIKIRKHAAVIEGHILPDRKKRRH